jgi:hypothetical protein
MNLQSSTVKCKTGKDSVDPTKKILEDLHTFTYTLFLFRFYIVKKNQITNKIREGVLRDLGDASSVIVRSQITSSARALLAKIMYTRATRVA